MVKLNRKDIILYLLYANGMQPVTGRTRLQKVLFLLEKEQKLASHLKSTFDFEPWKFGPYSAELLRDIEFLENVGLLKSKSVGLLGEPERKEQDLASLDYIDDASEYSPEQLYVQEEFCLTEHGLKFVQERIEPRLSSKIKTAIATTKKKYGRLSLSSLLRYVYIKYPRYAAKSELKQYL